LIDRCGGTFSAAIGHSCEDRAGVDVLFGDLPAIEGPTGRFMLQQMVSVAELEAGMILARTKAGVGHCEGPRPKS
jgi:DNA invertase Pin-like site-specific DNA recombinase